MIRVRSLKYAPGTSVNASREYLVGKDFFLEPDPTPADLRRFEGAALYQLVEVEEPATGQPEDMDAAVELALEMADAMERAEEGPDEEDLAEGDVSGLETLLGAHHKVRAKAAKLLDPEFSSVYKGKKVTDRADACIRHYASGDPEAFNEVLDALDIKGA